MKKIYLWALVAVFALSACGLTKKDLGLEHRGPNEATVKTNRPLSLPPEYDVRPQKTLPYKNPTEDEVKD